MRLSPLRPLYPLSGRAVSARLRFERVPLLVLKNRSGVEVFYHVVSQPDAVTVEGYWLAGKGLTAFEGRCPASDRPALSEMERLLAESQTTL